MQAVPVGTGKKTILAFFVRNISACKSLLRIVLGSSLNVNILPRYAIITTMVASMLTSYF